VVSLVGQLSCGENPEFDLCTIRPSSLATSNAIKSLVMIYPFRRLCNLFRIYGEGLHTSPLPCKGRAIAHEGRRDIPLAPTGRGRDPRSGRVRGTRDFRVVAGSKCGRGYSPSPSHRLRDGPLPLPEGRGNLRRRQMRPAYPRLAGIARMQLTSHV